MIETVVSMGLAVDEAMEIRKNHLAPKVLTGKEKRICILERMEMSLKDNMSAMKLLEESMRIHHV